MNAALPTRSAVRGEGPRVRSKELNGWKDTLLRAVIARVCLRVFCFLPLVFGRLRAITPLGARRYGRPRAQGITTHGGRGRLTPPVCGTN